MNEKRSNTVIERVLSVGALLLGVGVAVLAASLGDIGLGRRSSNSEAQVGLIEIRLKRLELIIDAQQQQVRTLDSTFAALAASASPRDLATAVFTARARTDLSQVQKRLGDIETAILESPTKAISVPLLRQDFENLRGRYEQQLATSAKEIDRIYDQNKWFIGLVFTMALGLIGLAVSNFLQTRHQQTKQAT